MAWHPLKVNIKNDYIRVMLAEALGTFVLVAFGLGANAQTATSKGSCHDQADAEWIVIRGPLRGHNNMPYGRLTPGQPVGCPESATLRAYFLFSVAINL
jgi:hypothetical protein